MPIALGFLTSSDINSNSSHSLLLLYFKAHKYTTIHPEDIAIQSNMQP